MVQAASPWWNATKCAPAKKHCLWCKKYYTPSYPSKDEAKASGDLMAIEQWISGMCSDSCWSELFGNIEGK